MDRYPRLFILAAIGYLLTGVVLGIGFTAGELDPATLRFVHIHLNLLGFMAMFVYGVGYHILPRFNAAPVKHPGLIGMHFWFVNTGLVGMSLGAIAGGVYGTGTSHAIFLAGSILEVMGIFIFAFNLVPVLLPAPVHTVPVPVAAPAAPPKTVPPAAPVITPDMRVVEILEKFPRLEGPLVSYGFKTLAIPAARASFAKTTTLEQACRIHRLDGGEIAAKLNTVLAGGAVAASPQPAPVRKAAEPASKGEKIKRGDAPTAATLIGALLEAYPEAKPVFEKNYGEGCFSCAGQAFETLAQTADMHGMKVEKILDEINQAIEAAK